LIRHPQLFSPSHRNSRFQLIFDSLFLVFLDNLTRLRDFPTIILQKFNSLLKPGHLSKHNYMMMNTKYTLTRNQFFQETMFTFKHDVDSYVSSYPLHSFPSFQNNNVNRKHMVTSTLDQTTPKFLMPNFFPIALTSNLDSSQPDLAQNILTTLNSLNSPYDFHPIILKHNLFSNIQIET
jgi:hypothetical protein